MDFSLNVKDSKKSITITVAILLVIVVCVFIGILFFLKVFPRLSNVTPSAVPSATPGIAVPPSFSRIKTTSEIQGYALDIANQQALEQLLSDYGFWDFYQWDQYGTKASQLYIIFTDKVQPLYKIVTQDKSILSSYGVFFDKGNVFVQVQIDPTIDHFDTRASNIVTKYVGKFLYSIYPSSKKATLSEDVFLKSLYDGPDLFSIIKT